MATPASRPQRWWSIEEAAAARIDRSSLRAWADGGLSYLERRPAEAGRAVVVWVDPDTGRTEDRSPRGRSVGTRILGYGSSAVALLEGRTLCVVDAADSQIWSDEGGGFRAVLEPSDPARYGELAALDATHLVAVAEEGGDRPQRRLVTIEVSTGRVTTLFQGPDFLLGPVVNPGGTKVAFVGWDRPQMPWEGAQVLELDLRSQSVTVVAGAQGGAAYSPIYGPDGRLWCIDERAGWSEPWVLEAGVLRQALTTEADWAEVPWTSERRSMAPLGDGRVVLARSEGWRDVLVLATPAGEEVAIESDLVKVQDLLAYDGGVAILGSTGTERVDLLLLDPSTGECRRPVPRRHRRRPTALAERLEFCAASDGRVLHGAYTPPGSESRPPAAGPPPLILSCHGGPTASCDPSFDPVVQVLSSRGFAVAHCDYRGSTGYGRQFRRALDGHWGVADAEDAADLARALVAAGLADPSAIGIRGGSAGGLTALNAMASGVFVAAAVRYGVADLLRLAEETHDFEAGYLDTLVGPLPEAASRYRAQSPINRVERFQGAFLLLQGREDPVVPLSQAEAMASALRAGGRPVELVVFDGEGHGFRRADTQAAALVHEVRFFTRFLRPSAAVDR